MQADRRILWAIRLVLLLAVQFGILGLVAAEKIRAEIWGREILIRTAPYDPYDFLSGYHAALRYEISQLPEDVEKERFKRNDPVYVLLAPDPNDAWQIESVHAEPVFPSGENTVMLRGRVSRDRILYGIEHFYFPETQRDEINSGLREHPGQSYARIKVSRGGHAVLQGLIIRGKEYGQTR